MTPDNVTQAEALEPFLTQLRRVNTDRYHAWVGDGQDAGILFDAAELGGEVGELLNVVKKLEREERGWRGSRAAPEDFADECADVLICLDKLARRRGVDLAAATIAKFNATSEKVGLPHRLAYAKEATPSASDQYLTARIGEIMADDGGCWHACSGCQESSDGYVSRKDYPYSDVFKCQPGSGCHECGGIGVLWEDGAFLRGYADALSTEPATPSASVEREPYSRVDDELHRAFIDGWNARLDHADFDMALHYWLLSGITQIGPATPTPEPVDLGADAERGAVTRDDLYRMIDGFSDFLTFDADQRMKMRSRVRVYCAMAEAKHPASVDATIERLREVARAMLPKNVCLTNPRWPDDTVVPLETTMGELRTLAAALSASTAQDGEAE